MNLINLFENAVSDFPRGIAIKGSNFSFSYSEFDAITHNFAHQLIETGVRQDDIVGMCTERSPEMLVGIFGILKAGAAYLPVDASHPPKRIVSLLTDAGVKWVITTSGLADFVSELGFSPIVPDCSVPARLNTTVLRVIPDEATAYVLFTSGSTGAPKGVLISHSSVVNLLLYMQENYPLEEGDTVMLKSPYTFDGSVWELFGWMKMGGTLFISPAGAEKDPGKLSEIIEKEKIGFLFFVPSMLSVFTSYCTLHKTSFDSLKWVSVGGEVLPLQLVNAFYQLFDYQKVKLINVYGPTETTVYATTYCCFPGIKSGKIPIGNAVTNNTIYIVDEFLHAVPDGQEGEICIGGAGVGKGYLNRPELTAEKFVDNTITGTGKIYRTGDFGRRNENGYFEFIGRRDFQIKLRGLRIETGEIEQALLQFDGIAECVVLMLKDRQGDDCLTAYLRLQTTDPDQAETWYPAPGSFKEQLTSHLLEWLPSYMLPSDYIIYKSFPLTAHGKIDRTALVQSRETGVNAEENPNETATETECRIRILWQAVTGKKQIGLHEDFFATGGHSLKVIQLITLIIREMGYEVPIRDFYNGITISSMSEQIDKGSYIKVQPPEKRVKPDVRQTVFPLTPVQTEMWIMNSIDDTGLSHNIQVEFTLVGHPDIERFKQSVTQTVQHEEMFRSVFEVNKEVPVQRLLPGVEVDIPEVDLSKTAAADKTSKYNEILFAHGNTLFEPDKLPLFSFIFIKWSENEYRLLLTVHHLIFDGWSLHLFMKRIARHYLNEDPEESIWRNADYAWFLKQPEILKKTIKELEFWTSSLKDIPAFLSLPQKPQANSVDTRNRGDRLWWTMSKELSAGIDQFALATRTTPFVVFMSGYQLALAAAANQHDIVIGSPLANRNNNMITDLIGYYTNMVCIRGAWDGSSSVLNVIENCNAQVINAFLNSTVSYGEIAKRLNKTNGIACNSVFHAIFVMQNWPHDNLELPGFSLSQREIGNNTAKTGFLFNVEYRDGAYVCWLEY
ncbi:MAG: amino acid adenylation domain-containing protein, partial [Bacteroidetes bacterium]|nr:amino acid adenylation domain-containing protein [Bacteroidota bacterium]